MGKFFEWYRLISMILVLKQWNFLCYIDYVVCVVELIRVNEFVDGLILNVVELEYFGLLLNLFVCIKICIVLVFILKCCIFLVVWVVYVVIVFCMLLKDVIVCLKF